VREAARLGFRRVLTPPDPEATAVDGAEVIETESVADAVRWLRRQQPSTSAG